MVVAIVGNKSDCPEDDRQVSEDELHAYAERNGCLSIITSALLGRNVRKMFRIVAMRLEELEIEREEADEAAGAASGPGVAPGAASHSPPEAVKLGAPHEHTAANASKACHC